MRVDSFHPSFSPLQAAGIEYVHQLAVVLLEASLGLGRSPGDVEGLGDQRGKALDQHPRDERDEHEVHVCVEGANPRAKGIVIDPGRRLVESVEEVAQGLRRLVQNVVLLLNASPDEVVQNGGRQRRQLLHDRVEHGVADGGVPDVVVGCSPIVTTGPGIPFGIR